jgi:hypothetical protein
MLERIWKKSAFLDTEEYQRKAYGIESDIRKLPIQVSGWSCCTLDNERHE